MAECPVHKVQFPDDSTAWLVTGFRETREVMVDLRYSRALVYDPARAVYGIDAAAAGSILAADPPEHTRLRKLVAGAFTAKRIKALQPRVAEITDDLIDAMLAGPRPADLVRSFASALPSSVICLLLGVPVTDAGLFRAWTEMLLGDWSRSPEEIGEAYAAMGGYMSELIARKREEPGEDLISVLIDARDSAGKLSEEELVNFCVVLLAAGYETTANGVGLMGGARGRVRFRHRTRGRL